MKINRKSAYILFTVVFSALLMSFIDGFLHPPYFYKSLFKILLFAGVPAFYFLTHREELHQLKKLFVPRKKDFIISLSLGVGVYCIIMLGYFLFYNHIDLSVIQESLTAGMGVTKNNFLYVALYISFINSLLEEFFFRGFAFIVLKQKTSRLFAYVFSALLFSIYHVGMTSGWFHWGIYLLAMLGLFIGGCIFNFLNEKCENIYPSWLVHMCANFAINTVGFILFGLL